MLSPRVHELDIAAVSSAFRRSVEDACPEHLSLAVRALERLEPERWTLEWYLPWWLGLAFGLDAGTAAELVLSNVLGLASIRLQDDLADGDVAPDEVPATTALSADLYRLALEPYRTRFAASSPFWERLDGWMSTWRAATDRAATPHGASWTRAGGGAKELATRGAPLKIPTYAICALTGRLDSFPTLERALDHALAGLVLYDHIGDWRGDLAAGRWNAFVAAVSDQPQDPGSRDRNRARVLVAMLTEDAVASHVRRVTTELTRAAVLFENLGLLAFVAHLREAADSIEAQGASLQASYRATAQRAGDLLLAAPVRDPSRDARLAASVPRG